MKIALVHYSALPVIGGVEVVMAAHARLFADAGHEVTIVCGRGVSEDSRILLELLPPDDEALPAMLRTVLARQDVVVVHNVMTMHFRLRLTEALWNLADELTGVRFLAWVHDLAACNEDYDIASPALQQLARRHPRVEYVAVSELRQRQFLELTGEACPVIPNGVEPAQVLGLSAPVAALAERFGLFDREVVLLHPTRILRRKNIELGLRVTAEIKPKFSCAYLVTGPPDLHHAASAGYATELRALRTELGLEEDALFLHEHFSVGDEDMRSLYELADALFFPSRQEGFGLPVLEAALHRLPIFCADIEPLNALLPRRLSLFPLDDPPRRIATRIALALHGADIAKARKETLRRYAWTAIHRNFLAPLLAGADTRLQP